MSDVTSNSVPAVSEVKRGRGRPRKHMLIWDAKYMREQYVINGLTLKQIADEVGCTAVNVAYAMEKLGIARRPVGTRGRVKTPKVIS